MADIKPFLNKIKTAVFGKDVRGSLHDGLEAVNKETEDATALSKDTERRQGAVEHQFDDVLSGWSDDKPIDNEETIASRTNRETGENYTTLGNRLDTEHNKISTDIKDEIERTQREFSERGVNIKWFEHLKIAVNGGYDWTPAIQAAIDELEEGQELFIPAGSYYASNLSIKLDEITFRCNGFIVQFKNALGPLFEIGDSTKPNFRIKGNLNIKQQERNWLNATIGVKLVNMNEANLNIMARDFTHNIVLAGYDNGCAYNNITPTLCLNAHKNIAFETKGTGWVNENKFYGGRFGWNTNITETDRYHIYIPDTTMNNNSFFGPSFEGRGGGTFVYCNGQYNHFYTPRLEGDGLKVHFGKESIYNTIFYPYGLHLTDSDEFKDEGSRNHMFLRDELSFDRTSVMMGSTEIIFNPDASASSGSAGVDVVTTRSSKDKAQRVRDSLGNEKYSVLGDGTVTGKQFNLNNGLSWDSVGTMAGGHIPLAADSYLTNSLKIVAIKTTSGPPTASTSQKGAAVLNTADSKLYFHFGGGNWKGVQLT